MSRSGTSRPRNAELTRARLLAAARREFTEHGYDGTSVRTVAAEAGVAPNLITRYFGGKEGLFAAATDLELDVPAVLPGPPERLGERIATAVVNRWEAAGAGDPLLMMLRSAGTSAPAAQTLADFFASQAAGPLAAHLATERHWTARAAEDRVAAIGALILGVVTMRYVMRRGPLAQAGVRPLTGWLADRLQRLLDDPAPPSLLA